MTKASEILHYDQEYEYGFHDDIQPVFSTGRGLTEEFVRAISKEKNEPEWMLDYRLKAYEIYKAMPMPKFGPDLSELDLDHMLYYQKMTDKKFRDWEEVPDDLKKTFNRLGVPEAERKYLAGSSAQYESEVVYHNMREEFEKLGINGDHVTGSSDGVLTSGHLNPFVNDRLGPINLSQVSWARDVQNGRSSLNTLKLLFNVGDVAVEVLDVLLSDLRGVPT